MAPSYSLRNFAFEFSSSLLFLQGSKHLDRLAFLYVLTGNFERLAKVGNIADERGNLAVRFQITPVLVSRYLGSEGDFEEPPGDYYGDYYEDAAAFEASERDAVWDKEDEATNAAVHWFAVGLGTEDTAANGDDAWEGDFDVEDSGLGGEEFVGGEEKNEFDDEFGRAGGGKKGREYYVAHTAGPGAASQ
ncbi:hypothetical protein BWQ96_00637 [Gracilariopsis chorda]|uniref:Uncharacterized protein n=1 Tax=Gracilariopsis chorda TaxID=448386 RepID=A0A2V3J6E8_9FLOR|nr:hypothetical protein BWQ96_00637 [Gracilariopsis chorda]|eukprot:PXF49567.1 hypothetical protein BWQ96_00637 [Gracilariopsis chorda]